jgi:hypothetical protein
VDLAVAPCSETAPILSLTAPGNTLTTLILTSRENIHILATITFSAMLFRETAAQDAAKQMETVPPLPANANSNMPTIGLRRDIHMEVAP